MFRILGVWHSDLTVFYPLHLILILKPIFRKRASTCEARSFATAPSFAQVRPMLSSWAISFKSWSVCRRSEVTWQFLLIKSSLKDFNRFDWKLNLIQMLLQSQYSRNVKTFMLTLFSRFPGLRIRCLRSSDHCLIAK